MKSIPGWRFLKKKSRFGYVKTIAIGTAVVLFWRGIWGIADMHLFPGNPLLSFSVSVFIGIAILAVTHTLSKIL